MHSFFTKHSSRGFSAVGTILVSTLFAAGGYGAVALENHAEISSAHDTVITDTHVNTNASDSAYLGGSESKESPWLKPNEDRATADADASSDTILENQDSTALQANVDLSL